MINFAVKVNNQSSSSGAVRVTNGRPVISWAFDETPTALLDEYGIIASASIVDQSTYRIRIGTSQDNWGSFDFIGDVKNTGVVSDACKTWAYTGPILSRGITYFGQILVKDQDNRGSGWVTFSFTYNILPVITGVEVLPSIPNANDTLTLSYSFVDDDGDLESGTKIQWFRNGAHERQYDSETSIGSEFLVYGETWQAHVFPSDGFELGTREVSNVVTVSTNVPVGSGTQILPRFPNENDILKADYSFSSDLTVDKSRIRWYVNNVVQTDVDDQQFARLSLTTGDKVRFEAQPFDGVRYGNVVSSETVTIADAPFIVEDVKIEGQLTPLSLLSLRPAVSWSVCVPTGKAVEYLSIRIGTVAGGDNVHSETIQSTQTSFRVPDNLLQRGTDYFVSIAVSDTDTFDRYSINHFRTSGSRWESLVSNVVGWTVELTFNVDPGENGEFDSGNFQFVRFQDGTKFGEVRMYADRLGFLSSGTATFTSTTFDLTRFRVLTIVGRGDDVSIYLDRTLVLDMESMLVQESSAKRLEFGVATGNLTARYQSIYYTTNGSFHPGVSEEYTTLQFHEYASFPFHEAVGLKGFVENNENKKVFAINPNDASEGGSVFIISPGGMTKFGTAPRSFAPINSACTSLNSLYKVFSHARGASIMKSYLINNYDHFIDFTGSGNVDPSANGWELVQNFGPSGAKKDGGWLIDTTVSS